MAGTDSQTAAVESEIAHLRGLDLDALRARWRSQTGREALSHLRFRPAAARAALTRLRQAGHALEKSKGETGATAYRIAAPASSSAISRSAHFRRCSATCGSAVW